MTAIAPQTDVYLLKVPLEIDNINQLTFANATAQHNYFSSLPKLEADNFTYQRKDGTIRFSAIIDDIMSYNYVMYRNDAYSNKWFYAYITNMTYVNDSVTAIQIKTDVWQTWQFDLNYKPTFIQREHTNNDTIGYNTVPENVEIGEPVINGNIEQIKPYSDTTFGYLITFMVSDKAPLSIVDPIPSQYNGIYSGYTLVGVENNEQADEIVDAYVDNTRADAIKNIFLVPKALYGSTPIRKGSERFSFQFYIPEGIQVPVSLQDDKTISRVSTIDGYTPKNNKLYTWPYSYLFVTNNVGGNVEYRYEDFLDATPHFRLSGIISSGCDIKLKPIKYKNITGSNEAYGLKMSKLPVCSWNTDSYAIWLAQNQLNMNVLFAKEGLRALGGIATRSPETLGEAGGNMLGGVLNSLAQGYITEHLPDQVHGDPNSSDYNFSGEHFIDVRRMSVRQEYARIIDDYFSQVGYATNRVKLPNITGRRNWNFVKTTNCYIDADIPQDDLQEIKGMFDRGVTFWHNPATFADYTQNNDIIS